MPPRLLALALLTGLAAGGRLRAAVVEPDPPGTVTVSLTSVKTITSRSARRARRVGLLELGAAESVREGVHTSARAKGGGYEKGPAPVMLSGAIRIGSPPQMFTVAFDTGSGNVMVPQRNCQSLSCLSHRGYDEALSALAKPIVALDNTAITEVPQSGHREEVTYHFGSGNIKGSLVRDRVCLGVDSESCATTAFIQATEMSSEPFSLFTFDGILGLGLPGTSLAAEFNFMGNLAEERVLKTNVFAVWIADDDEGVDSEVRFGGWNSARLGSAIVWLPVKWDTGGWEVTMEDFTIKSNKLNQCKGGCKALLDTGTNAIGAPSSAVAALLRSLNVLQDCSNFATLPLLGFTLGEKVLNLEPKDYVKKTDQGCFHQIFAIDVPPPKGPLVLLGQPFLRRYYTIYDRSTLKVGLCLAAHKLKANDTSDQETSVRLITDKR